MGKDTEDLMRLLSDTTEENLGSFIENRVQDRIGELKERQKRLQEEQAAITHELELLSQYAQGSVHDLPVDEILSKLLKK